MRIGQLASQTGSSVETIRYYEQAGLLPQPARLPNGYRSYGQEHLKWLKFVLRSRSLGFSQRQARQLIELAEKGPDACGDVHQMLLDQVQEIDQKLDDLGRLRKALLSLEKKCLDKTLHSCPVIDELMDQDDQAATGT